LTFGIKPLIVMVGGGQAAEVPFRNGHPLRAPKAKIALTIPWAMPFAHAGLS